MPRRPTKQSVHLVVDATGVKVYGEGEWKVRQQHGYSKRRTWRKLHFAVDEARLEFVAVTVSTDNFKDSPLLPDLLEQVGNAISQVSAGGDYDTRTCYTALHERGARAVIPPRRGARIWQHANTRGERHNSRDENLRAIRRRGRAAWKRESDYHQRSLAETQVMRVKTIFGERVSARSFDAQAAQLLIRCAALNRMTHLGMPNSYPV